MNKFNELCKQIITENNEYFTEKDEFIHQLKEDFGKALSETRAFSNLSSHDNMGSIPFGVEDKDDHYEFWVANRGQFDTKVVDIMKQKYPNFTKINDGILETIFILDKPTSENKENNTERIPLSQVILDAINDEVLGNDMQLAEDYKDYLPKIEQHVVYDLNGQDYWEIDYGKLVEYIFDALNEFNLIKS